MADAARLVVAREDHPSGRLTSWKVVLDGEVCAAVDNAATVSVIVVTGRHRLVVANGRRRSNEIVFDIDEAGEFGVRASPPASRLTGYGMLSRFAPVIRWQHVSAAARVVRGG